MTRKHTVEPPRQHLIDEGQQRPTLNKSRRNLEQEGDRGRIETRNPSRVERGRGRTGNIDRMKKDRSTPTQDVLVNFWVFAL